MELELNETTMKALAKEIARAQLTAADEYIDEQIAEWPDEFKRNVGNAGAVIDADGRVLSQAQRLDAFRANQGAALRAIEAERKQEERNAQRLAATLAEAEARDNAEILKNQALYDADVAQWKADSLVAKQSGRQAPPEPQRENYALTRDELAKARHRARMNF